MTHIKDRETGTPTSIPNYENIDFITIQIGTNGGVGISTFYDIPMIIGNTVLDLPFEYKGATINTEDEYWALFPNRFYSNIALCIEYVQAKNPNTKIFLITPPITKFLGLDYDCGIKKVRKALIEIGEHYAVPVIDAQVNAGIWLHNIYKCTIDGTHLNEFGNKLWGTYIGEQILVK